MRKQLILTLALAMMCMVCIPAKATDTAQEHVNRFNTWKNKPKQEREAMKAKHQEYKQSAKTMKKEHQDAMKAKRNEIKNMPKEEKTKALKEMNANCESCKTNMQAKKDEYKKAKQEKKKNFWNWWQKPQEQ